MYRVRGHLNAHLDPLSSEPPALHAELDLATYGLTIWDLQRSFVVDGLAGLYEATLEKILAILRDAYCRTTGIEYGHIMDPVQKRWIQERVEGVSTATTLDEQRRILGVLSEAEVFERFLHSRYVGQKRFGLEGAESTIVALQTVLDEAADRGLKEAVIGMAHRGRLNVLANIVGKSYSDIFSEFEGNLDPESVQGSGDVKYHKGARGVFKSPSGATIDVSMASNPSHLEAVSPVVEGIVRAKQDLVIRPSDGTRGRPASWNTRTWRCSSTATRPSRARASSPRHSTSRSCRAIASAARFISSSTTRWASRRRPNRRVRASIRPTSPR